MPDHQQQPTQNRNDPLIRSVPAVKVGELKLRTVGDDQNEDGSETLRLAALEGG